MKASILVDPHPENAVHFHADGLNGEPAACFEARCSRPALDARRRGPEPGRRLAH